MPESKMGPIDALLAAAGNPNLSVPGGALDRDVGAILDFETEDILSGYRGRDKYRNVKILQLALFERKAQEAVTKSWYTDVLEDATRELVATIRENPEQAKQKFLARVMRAKGAGAPSSTGFGESILKEGSTMANIFRRQVEKTKNYIGNPNLPESKLYSEQTVISNIIERLNKGQAFASWNVEFDKSVLAGAAQRVGLYGDLQDAFRNYRKMHKTKEPFRELSASAQEFLYENTRFRYLEEYGKAGVNAVDKRQWEVAAKRLSKQEFDWAFRHTKDKYAITEATELTLENASEMHQGFHRFFTDASDDPVVRRAMREVLDEKTDVHNLVQLDYRRFKEWGTKAGKFYNEIGLTQNYATSQLTPQVRFMKGWSVDTLSKALGLDQLSGALHAADVDVKVEGSLAHLFDRWRNMHQQVAPKLEDAVARGQVAEAAQMAREVQEQWFSKHVEPLGTVKSLDEFHRRLQVSIRESALEQARELRTPTELSDLDDIIGDVVRGTRSNRVQPGGAELHKVAGRLDHMEFGPTKLGAIVTDEVLPGLRNLWHSSKAARVGMVGLGVLSALSLGDFNVSNWGGSDERGAYSPTRPVTGESYHQLLQAIHGGQPDIVGTEVELQGASFRSPGKPGYLDMLSSRYGPIEIKSYDPGPAEYAQLSNYIRATGMSHGYMMQVNPYNVSDITIDMAYPKDRHYLEKEFKSRWTGKRYDRSDWHRYLGIKEQYGDAPFGSGFNPDKAGMGWSVGGRVVRGARHKRVPRRVNLVQPVPRKRFSVPHTVPKDLGHTAAQDLERATMTSNHGIKRGTHFKHGVPKRRQSNLRGGAAARAGVPIPRARLKPEHIQHVRDMRSIYGSGLHIPRALKRATFYVPPRIYAGEDLSRGQMLRRLAELNESLKTGEMILRRTDSLQGRFVATEQLLEVTQQAINFPDPGSAKLNQMRFTVRSRAERLLRSIAEDATGLFQYERLPPQLQAEVKRAGLTPSLYDEYVKNSAHLKIIREVGVTPNEIDIARRNLRRLPIRLGEILPEGKQFDSKRAYRMALEKGEIPDAMPFNQFVRVIQHGYKPGGKFADLDVGLLGRNRHLPGAVEETLTAKMKDMFGFTDAQARHFVRQTMDVSILDEPQAKKAAGGLLVRGFRGIQSMVSRIDAVSDAIIKVERELTDKQLQSLKLTTRRRGILGAVESMGRETIGRLLYGDAWTARAVSYKAVTDSKLTARFFSRNPVAKKGIVYGILGDLEDRARKQVLRKGGHPKNAKFSHAMFRGFGSMKNARFGFSSIAFLGLGIAMSIDMMSTYENQAIGFAAETSKLAVGTLLWENASHGGLGFTRAWSAFRGNRQIGSKVAGEAGTEAVGKAVKRFGAQAIAKAPGLWGKIGAIALAIGGDIAFGALLDMVTGALGLRRDPEMMPVPDTRYDYERGEISGMRSPGRSQYGMEAMRPSGPNYSNFGSRYRPPPSVTANALAQIPPDRYISHKLRQPKAGMVNEVLVKNTKSSNRQSLGEFDAPHLQNQGALVA